MSALFTQNSLETEAGLTQATETRKAMVQQLIVFRLGEEEYGLAIEQVKEIVVTPPIARIPLMPAYVKGVANVRGNILAIIDPAERFGLNDPHSTLEEKVKSFLLVMESDTLKMGMLVREVPSTLRVTQDQIEHAPSLVQDSSGDHQYMKGIIRVGTRLIILMDVYQMISKEVLQKVSA